MARVRTHGASAIRSLGLFVVVWLVSVYRTNTGIHTDAETEGDEFHILAAAQKHCLIGERKITVRQQRRITVNVNSTKLA